MSKLHVLIIMFSLFGFSSNAFAEREFDGYSYLSIQYARTSYSENTNNRFNGKKIKTNVEVTSPIYLSGGLFKINKSYDFSLDAKSTLMPQNDKEKWTADKKLQENDFDIMINDLQGLIHYKFTNRHRLVFGGGFNLNTFKRYNFESFNANVAEPLGVVEERIAILSGRAGYVYESNTAALKGFRYRVSVIGGVPIWLAASNTYSNKVKFNDKGGYFGELGGYIGYAVMKNIEVGISASYNYMFLEGGEESSDGATVEWPENKTKTLSMGLQLTWKL